MCGIIGYTGIRDAVKIIIDGLTALEYRGYDSAGLSLSGKNGIKTIKCPGRVSVLAEEAYADKELDGKCGIGHTRWATHGAPVAKNAHPHESEHLTLVHNGIIENYLELRKMLTGEGYSFASDTDTECAAHLIDKYYKCDKNPVTAIKKACASLTGSYALAMIFRDRPNDIYAVRKDNPLVAAFNEDGCFVASDIPAILPYTRSIIRINEGEVIRLADGKVTAYGNDGVAYEKETEEITWKVGAAGLDGFPYYMLKEIYEEPDAVRRCTSHRVGADGLPDFSADGIPDSFLRDVDSISIIGCGSATNAGEVGRKVIEELAKIPVTVNLASEYRYAPPVSVGKNLVIPISQSGETADTLAALRLSKDLNGEKLPSLGIINVQGSAIARESDYVMYTNAGPEIAVATTKGYATQTATLCMLAVKLALLKGRINEDRARKLCFELTKTIPSAISELISRRDEIKKIAEKIYEHNDVFFIGRGPDSTAGVECSLKLKEISYIHSESYPAGELKHGTLSLVTEGTPVFALVNCPEYYDKMTGNIREVKSRGGHVIIACGKDFREPEELTDDVFIMPSTEAILSPFMPVVFSQLLAYETALLRGCDVDHPRNLAKSVTVE